MKYASKAHMVGQSGSQVKFATWHVGFGLVGFLKPTTNIKPAYLIFSLCRLLLVC
jgi:hypothetical protein